MATRTLSDIARDIRTHWVDKSGKPNVYFGAVPYLDAMSSMGSIDTNYGLDDGKYIVTYFLSNASTFRGEHARRIKAELKSLAGIK